jgi:hypothetical protein
MSDAQSPPPPRPVANAPQRDINLTGYFFPWQDDAPVLMKLDGTGDFFLPLFSTVEKLREMVSVTAIEMDGIKRIDNGPEFLSSIPTELSTGGQRLRIMVDPHRTEDDNYKTRFTEVIRGARTT